MNYKDPPESALSGAPLALGGTLALVKDLHLRAKDLHATVPARVAWQSVCLQADSVLSMSFACLAAFAAAAPVFCFSYRALEVGGCALPESPLPGCIWLVV